MSEQLSNYAVTSQSSLGRAFPEQAHPYRSDFERDRDRIIHCSAFRRLEGKTQVFTPGLDDYYRTRLTHSIEVAQIARTIAKALHFNESLTEAIALAHDLGHSPFGHAGEKKLNELMSSFGGFEHNRQTLRIVDLLEHPYPNFMGLNLMYETRLGLAKHRSPYDKPESDEFSQVNCSLEGQIADLADRIAYDCHDLEDGMRAGLLSEENVKSVEIVSLIREKIKAESISDRTIRRTRTSKAIIDMLVSDCLETSRNIIENAKIKTLDDVYSYNENLIRLSNENNAKLRELEDFLMQNFYLHESLRETTEKIGIWLQQVFESLCNNRELMPTYFQRFIDQHGLQRVVCDYIAGMTDRYCLKMLEDVI